MEYGESTAESAELMTCDWCFATAQQPHPQRCLGEPQHDQLWRSIADHFAHESGVPPGERAAAPPWSCLGQASASPDVEKLCRTPLKTGMWSGTHLVKRTHPT